MSDSDGGSHGKLADCSLIGLGGGALAILTGINMKLDALTRLMKEQDRRQKLAALLEHRDEP